MPKENLYDLLQVGPSASPEVIRAVYRRLILLHHPDRNAGVDVDDMALRLNDAYTILSDPEQRAAYDQQLLTEEEDLIAGTVGQDRASDAGLPRRMPKFIWSAMAAGVVGIIAIIAVIASAGGSGDDQVPSVAVPLPTPTTAPTPRPTDVVSVPPPTPQPTAAPSAASYLDSGTNLMRNGDFFGAIEEFTSAINIFPTYGYGYQIRGNTYFQTGQYQQAIGDYTIAIQLDPTDKSIYRDRGLTYFQLDQFQQAIQDFNQAIQLDPGYAVVLNLRSLSYNQLQNFQSAKIDAEQACALEIQYCPTVILVTPTATPTPPEPAATPQTNPTTGRPGTEFFIPATTSLSIKASSPLE